MNRKMKKIIGVIAALLLPVVVLADGVTFTASAPEAIPNGQTFQIVYTVNARGKDLRVPEFAGFEILAGPFQSSSHSVQFINGVASSQTTQRKRERSTSPAQALLSMMKNINRMR